MVISVSVVVPLHICTFTGLSVCVPVSFISSAVFAHEPICLRGISVGYIVLGLISGRSFPRLYTHTFEVDASRDRMQSCGPMQFYVSGPANPFIK